MQIIEKPLKEVIPYEKNPRRNDAAVDAVAKSIQEFGWRQPLVLDTEGVIVAGHTRYKAARKLGLKSVPCVMVDDLTPQQIKAYRIADNSTNSLAEWDAELLLTELADLPQYDFAEFGLKDIDELLKDMSGNGEVIEDDFDVESEAEAITEPVTRRGDVWTLGQHRLVCGSSTDSADVARLMNGKTAKLLFTSPPYSDMREYNGGKDLSIANVSKFIEAYRPYTDYQCVNLGIQRREHEIVEYWQGYIETAKNVGYKLLAWNVWDKTMVGSIGQQSAFIPIRHEWIFVFGTEYYEINATWEKKEDSIKPLIKRTVRQANGTTKKTTSINTNNIYKKMESVCTVISEHGGIRSEHPAVFPIALPAEYIEAMTDKKDIVIEPFSGSGSTLIAAEQTGRICFAMELDPIYCDVIVKRYIKHKGSNDGIYLEHNGQRIEDINL